MSRQEPYITQKAGLMAGEGQANALVLGHHDLDFSVPLETQKPAQQPAWAPLSPESKWVHRLIGIDPRTLGPYFQLLVALLAFPFHSTRGRSDFVTQQTFQLFLLLPSFFSLKILPLEASKQ